MSSVSTLDMSSNLNIAGTITLDDASAQSITKSNDALTISATGTTTIESVVFDGKNLDASGSMTVDDVTFNGGAISTVTTLDMSSDLNIAGTITLDDANAQSITKSNDALTISADGTTTIESVVFDGKNLDASGSMTIDDVT